MDLGGGGAGGFGAATSVTFNSLNRGVILSHLHMWIMRDMPIFFGWAMASCLLDHPISKLWSQSWPNYACAANLF